MNYQKLFVLFTMIFTFVSCDGYQNGKVTIGEVSEGNLGESLTPRTPEGETEVVGENGEALVSQLNDLELHDLLDIFFSKFIIPINNVGEGFDTKVDYENLHKLYVSNDRLFIHMISSIEKQMNEIDLTTKSSDFKKAFYINAYNYSAIMIIVKNYIRSNGSKLKSIRKIGGVFGKKFIRISGSSLSLDDVEKKRLKGLMSSGGRVVDARFHFAVICASGGCPVTLNKAYREENLEESLDFITREGLKLPRILTRNGSRLGLTKIISSWYKNDFKDDAGSVENFLSNNGVLDTTGRQTSLSYDWNLNIIPTTRPTPDLSELETLVPAGERSEDREEDDEVVDSGCGNISGYTAKTQCEDILSANSVVSDLNVCIYTKNGSDKVKIVQTYVSGNKTQKTDHSFKGLDSSFETLKKKRKFFKKITVASFKMMSDEYSFESLTGNGVQFSASCVAL